MICHRFLISCLIAATTAAAHDGHEAMEWRPTVYPEAEAHAPRPLPDRIVLTWDGDPATTQAVTWRTDPSVAHGMAELALANANGRALKPDRFESVTTLFSSDLNDAHYHSVTFTGLIPDTLYAYRVGDGVNWSEYFHFKTASREPVPFSFIYFGDAQNEVKTHWSRVFREAFREAPRAAFTLHAGDLINEDAWDAEWGEWHGAPAWVNGTIPVIATPGNHEYFRANPGPVSERYWTTRDGPNLALRVESREERVAENGRMIHEVVFRTADGRAATIRHDDDDKILSVSGEIEGMTGFTAAALIGTEIDKAPLRDRRRDPGMPEVSRHWRPQFAFPVQDPPAGLEETCYYLDYQGARIISLDSSREREAQVGWLRKVLEDNPQRWTILTFHHPIFSPASDRDNRELRDLWKPVLDEFRVDLVLSGHDHTYARTGALSVLDPGSNLPTGYQQAYDPAIGTVYVVSVSGPKMYAATQSEFAVRVAEDTQLYQVIDVSWDELRFNAYTATGRLYDAFVLKKRPDGPNRLKELLPPENRRPAK